MTIKRLTPTAAGKLISNALIGAGTSERNAGYLTEAILDTELSGLEGHGFYWLQYYCQHVVSGKVDGKARPQVQKLSAVSFLADPRNGFAHPAIEAGFAKLAPAAVKHGVAALGVHNSYSGATLGFHTGYLAKQGLLAFGFTNAMPAMAPVGGRKAVIGTNPISFAVPGRNGKIAFLIDQSSTTATWTDVKRASDEGRDIPLGWGLDPLGQPTTKPDEALTGSMIPAGGHKGFGLGLMVEVMCAALTGSLLGPDMGSFMDDAKPIHCGQFFIAINPETFSGGLFHQRIDALVKSITSQEGARLPNARRMANQKRLRKEGLPIDVVLLEKLRNFTRH